ncbi:MAG: ATP-binding cassette domain-containing protein [Syntrophomonadaceae bacterium]|nr:ATP-binding cassette domain-containing protein [Syntrophomonadaceae bacterium]
MFSLDDIRLDYGPLNVLDRFNLNCKKQQFVCLFGPSGVGKTSILNILARLVKPRSGHVVCNSKRLAYVFQDPRLVPWLNVEQNLQLGMYASGQSARQRHSTVTSLLPVLGLDGFAKYYPGQLSGGMKQRVSLGRAFAIKPDMLLLDEPFSGLDAAIKHEMQDLLASLRQLHECTTVMVTHDEKEAIKLSDRVVVLNGRPCQTVMDIYPGQQKVTDTFYAQHLEASLLTAISNKDSLVSH